MYVCVCNYIPRPRSLSPSLAHSLTHSHFLHSCFCLFKCFSLCLSALFFRLRALLPPITLHSIIAIKTAPITSVTANLRPANHLFMTQSINDKDDPKVEVYVSIEA